MIKKLVNLTPHAITVAGGNVFPPDGTVARVATIQKSRGMVMGIPIASVAFGRVIGLPDPVEGTGWVVSGMVREAVPHRKDVFSPGALVRDGAGMVQGCAMLIAN